MLGLKDIFLAYDLKTFTDFDTEKHMYDYLKGLIYPEHSNKMRYFKNTTKQFPISLKNGSITVKSRTTEVFSAILTPYT